MPRRTDSNNPADWLYIAESDLSGLNALAKHELAYVMCRGKLAEVLEKVLKAELIRLGWRLIKTDDLEVLAGELRTRGSDLMGVVDPMCKALAEVYFASRYPGFDLEDPDWPGLRQQLGQVVALAQTVRSRLPAGG